MAAKERDVHHELLQEEDGGVGMMGEGGGGTDETQGGGGGKIEGKEGQDGGGDHARQRWEELAHGEGRGGNRDCGGGNGDDEGGSTEEEHADLPTCGGKR
jgi:hypothetical protein